MFKAQKYIKSIFLLFITFTVYAAEVDYSVGLTVAKYDNLNHEQNPAQGETSKAISGSLTVDENTPSLVANFDASLQAINYDNDQADDEGIGSLNASALWTISPSRFKWYVSDIFTQTSIDTFDSDTPNNRQNINIFTTGPDFTWRMNSKNNLNLEARVETISYERERLAITDADNDRIKITTSWVNQLRSGVLLSFYYSEETVLFDDPVTFTNFNRSDVFFDFNYQRGLNLFNTQIGTTRIDRRPSNAIDLNDTRFRLSVLNMWTRTSTIQLEINRYLTDTSNELLDRVSVNTLDGDVEAGNDDIYLNKTSRIIYTKTLPSGNIIVNANKAINDYQQQNTLDEIEKGVLITSIWSIHRTSRLEFTAQYINSVFNNISREDDDYLYGLAYTYNARRHITVGLEVESEERISSNSVNDFDDIRIFLSLTYRYSTR